MFFKQSRTLLQHLFSKIKLETAITLYTQSPKLGITLPADGLAPNGAKTSAGTVPALK